MKTVGLVHAVLPALAPMRDVLARLMPDVRIINLLDEGLLSEADRLGGLVPETLDRMTSVIGLLQKANVDAVLLTCTAYSPAVPEMQRRFGSLPIVAVDQTMVDKAITLGRRIGVLATVQAGLDQQVVLLNEAAARQGSTIEIVPSFHPDAMDALRRGDRDAHDRILLDALPRLLDRVDVALLAQVSMSPLAAKLPANLSKPVLSSPELAAKRLIEILAAV
ncbi:MAG TPA: aspartate/glutamate racemase family protein [Candidatus Acidoferrales bacterium]|nr:aspartate/glutamate racemase family protein [Candidatus Acidoferrales bacterium]